MYQYGTNIVTKIRSRDILDFYDGEGVEYLMYTFTTTSERYAEIAEQMSVDQDLRMYMWKQFVAMCDMYSEMKPELSFIIDPQFKRSRVAPYVLEDSKIMLYVKPKSVRHW